MLVFSQPGVSVAQIVDIAGPVIRIEPVGPTVFIPIPLPEADDSAVRLEAEDAVLTNAEPQSVHPDFTGSGYVVFLGEGELEWNFDIDMTGIYQLEFRYALEGDEAAQIDILGTDSIAVRLDTAFPGTQSVDSWKTVTLFARFEDGTNSVRVVTTGIGTPNFDHLLISLTPPDSNQFLTFPIHSSHAVFDGSEDNATAYYKVIDPFDLRTTFDDWRTDNGLTSCDPEDCAHAVYLNGADLNLGRRMFVRKRLTGDIASYVQNFPTLGDAVNQTNLVATVAMEYGPPDDDPSAPAFTKFFLFDANGERATKIDLDGRGEKYVPGVCNACHGGKPKLGGFHGDLAVYQDRGDTGAKWIPWDLDTYGYHPNLSRAEQEDEFKRLNAFILETDPTSATSILVEGWYGGEGLPDEIFNGNFVPTGWSDTPEGDKSKLYLEVVAPSCRACHNQRGSYNNSGNFFHGSLLQPDLEFNSFSDFASYEDEIERLVYDQGLMPLAKQTFENFWRSNQPRILDNELFGGQAYQNPPDDKYSTNASLTFGELRRPGRPVTKIAGARFSEAVFDTLFNDVQENRPVWLNGRPSLFAETFSWSFRAAPGDFPEIENSDRSLASFTLDPYASSDIKSGGSPYRIRLVAGNELSQRFGGYNDFIEGQLWSDSSLIAINFKDHVYPLLTTNFALSGTASDNLSCVHCHSNNGIPSAAQGVFELQDGNIPGSIDSDGWIAIAFSRVMTRVDCNDPENSLILKKPSGHHHYGGTVAGFDPASGVNIHNSGDDNHWQLIRRWIMEGAPYDAAGTELGCNPFPVLVASDDLLNPTDPLVRIFPIEPIITLTNP